MRITVFLIIFLSAVTAFGQSPQAFELFENGMAASRSGEHEKALKAFEQSLILATNERAGKKFLGKIHYNLGVSRFHLDRLDFAAVDFETAIKLAGGKYEKASYSLGLALSELGDYAKAERAFLDVLAVNKQNGEAWFDLAFVYLYRKEYDSAQPAFANAIRLGTVDSAVGHNNLGVLFAMNGDYETAAVQFEKAVANSKGKFPVAANNLNKCKTLRVTGPQLLANTGFEFVSRSSIEG